MNNSYSTAEQVHREVNFSTIFRTDAEQYKRPEHWVEAGRYGDCEDYALAKRGHLLGLGWPLDKMALCTCRTETGEGHCVLYVETDRGGYILDNRREWPVRPTQLPYAWESMLMGGKWYEIRGWHAP